MVSLNSLPLNDPLPVWGKYVSGGFEPSIMNPLRKAQRLVGPELYILTILIVLINYYF